jgi:hypothetical protein
MRHGAPSTPPSNPHPREGKGNEGNDNPTAAAINNDCYPRHQQLPSPLPLSQ